MRCETERSAALQGCPAAVGRPEGLRYERPPLASESERHYQRTLVPGGGGSSNDTTVGLPPSGLAASTIPSDSITISLAGFRLNTMTTVRPTRASGSYASAM